MQVTRAAQVRSGLTFHLQSPSGAVTSTVTTLDAPAQTMPQTVCDRQIIGVGNVGREPRKATYTLYSPDTNAVSFRTVRYGTQGKGFGAV